MKVLNRVQREYEQAIHASSSSSTTTAVSSSNTLPRNAFSALEQEKLASMLQAATTVTRLFYIRLDQVVNHNTLKNSYSIFKPNRLINFNNFLGGDE